jgi:hypothetical protein
LAVIFHRETFNHSGSLRVNRGAGLSW